MLIRTLPVVALASSIAAGGAGPVTPRAETIAAWTTYATATDRRVEQELASTSHFLAVEFGPQAASDTQALHAGAIILRRVGTGDAVAVPSGLIHHWRGAVLIPGLTLAELLASLQRDVPDLGQEDVLRAAVLERGAGFMKVFLKLRRTKFVTVVYNTEHIVRFRQFGTSRAFSSSTATKIAELQNPGTPAERELPPGQDRGFLWRWNAYWHYEAVPGGVIVECESLSLSRDVPAMLRYLVNPLIESTARESMERTLASMRRHFAKL